MGDGAAIEFRFRKKYSYTKLNKCIPDNVIVIQKISLQVFDGDEAGYLVSCPGL